MQSITLFIIMLMLSLSVYAVQASNKKKVEQTSFAEKRQNKARSIMNENFKGYDHSKVKNDKKTSFGFQKKSEVINQNL